MKTPKKVWRSILLAFAFLFASALPAFAAGGKNCINLDFSFANHTKGIEGGEFAVVKILDVENGTYQINASIGDIDMTVDTVLNDPENAAKLIADKKIKGVDIKTTGSDGKLSFDGLEDGVYLVRQTNRTGSAQDYNLSVPFLVELPHWEDNEYKNTVTVYPKTTKIEEPTEPSTTASSAEPTKPAPSTPVKTGDDTNVAIYIVLMLAALGIIGGVLIWRKGHKDEEK